MIIEWTLPAQSDLQEILAYVSQDNVNAAHDLIFQLTQSVETTLVDHPNAGRPGRVSGTREWVAHKNYVIAYRTLADRVQVLAVVHSARLWPQDL